MYYNQQIKNEITARLKKHPGENKVIELTVEVESMLVAGIRKDTALEKVIKRANKGVR